MVEAGEFGGPPNGYHPMPEGAQCKCLKAWTDGKGNHWCCLPIPAATPAPALPESGVDVEALAYRVANAKLGEGPSVRCEGPTDFEKDQARAWVRRVLSALATPAPAPAPAPAPVDAGGLVARLVKPLEWERWPEDGSECSEGQGKKRSYRQRALCATDAYFLMVKDGVYSVMRGLCGVDLQGIWIEADEAKAAAQADYTARILSALDSSALAAAAEREAALVRERDDWRKAAEQAMKAIAEEDDDARATEAKLAAAEARIAAAEARAGGARIAHDDWRQLRPGDRKAFNHHKPLMKAGRDHSAVPFEVGDILGWHPDDRAEIASLAFCVERIEITAEGVTYHTYFCDPKP